MDGEARDIVKEGIVSEVNVENHTARVTFEDKDSLVSAELPIITLWALDNKFYALPDVGETVLCLFATNDGTSGEGWIIGSRFHEKSKPNADSQDVVRVDFKDGTSVEYDRDAHAMNISCKGTLTIACDKEISISSKKDISIESKKGITIKATKDIQIKSKAAINMKGKIINLNDDDDEDEEEFEETGENESGE